VSNAMEKPGNFVTMPKVPRKIVVAASLVVLSLNGCAVVAVADAAVTVVATTVKVGATVVGATVDVAAAGVKAVIPGSDEAEK
jgi:uncharacterized lipoprotein NlpE involved in copper resistance